MSKDNEKNEKTPIIHPVGHSEAEKHPDHVDHADLAKVYVDRGGDKPVEYDFHDYHAVGVDARHVKQNDNFAPFKPYNGEPLPWTDPRPVTSKKPIFDPNNNMPLDMNKVEAQKVPEKPAHVVAAEKKWEDEEKAARDRMFERGDLVHPDPDPASEAPHPMAAPVAPVAAHAAPAAPVVHHDKK